MPHYLQSLPTRQKKRNVNFFAQLVMWLGLGLLVHLNGFAGSEPNPVSQEDFAAYKELQQTKLDALKEVRQTDTESWKTKAEALDKRVDDFNFHATVYAILVSCLLVLCGFVGYRNAAGDAKKAASEAAEGVADAWFSQHASKLKGEIQRLVSVSQGEIEALKDFANQEARTVFTLQKKLGYTPSYLFDEISRLADQKLPTQPNRDDMAESLRMKIRQALEEEKYADACDWWDELCHNNAPSENTYQDIARSFNKTIIFGACGIFDRDFLPLGSDVFGRFPVDEFKAVYGHIEADSLIRNGKFREAIDSYDLHTSLKGTSAFLRRIILSATVSGCALRLMSAKRKVQKDSHFQYLYADALKRLQGEIDNGIALALRAYLHYVIGNHAQAESDLSSAFQSIENGGTDALDALGLLLIIYPIPEDQGMRDLVDRIWREYLAANK